MLRRLGGQVLGGGTVGGAARRWVGSIVTAITVGIAYFLAARVGLALLSELEGVAVFWPASGVAAGFLIARGPSARAPVAIGVIVATVAANLMSDRSLWASIAKSGCNAGEALLTAWLVERWFGQRFELDTVRRTLGFLLAAALGAATAAIGGAAAMRLFHTTAPMLDIWSVWFLSDGLGILTIAPLLIGLARGLYDVPNQAEIAEGVIALLVLAAASAIGFGSPTHYWVTIQPLSLLLPLLLWQAARCPPVFAAAAVFVLTSSVVWTVTFGIGRLGDANVPLANRVHAAQALLFATTLCTLALAAVFTERRRNEAALDEGSRRLRSILDAANVIAWDVDLTRNTVHSSGPVGRLLNRPHGPAPRDFAALIEMIHSEDRECVMAQFWAAVSTGAAYRLEFRLRSNEGRARWVTAEGSIERDTNGRPEWVRGITHDITERKETELALAERDAQLALAGKTALVGNYVFDIKTGRMQISAGYTAIHGLPEGTEEYGRDVWRARVHPDDLGRLDALRSQAFAERRREHPVEYRIFRPSGEVRWIESRAFISYDGDGRAERMVGVNIDVTERKRAEQHQSLLIAELDHRVKNVLASVAVVAKRTSERSGSNGDFIDALDRRIQSMAAAHALLTRSRWRGVSLADVVRHELAPYAADGNTTIEGPYVGLTAAATQAMAMVLHELATNAAKYGGLSTPQGRVSVHWHWLSNDEVPAKLRLEWHEQRGPVVTDPAQPGYGTSVIRNLIPYELGGRVDLEFVPDGVRCSIEVTVESAQDRSVVQRIVSASAS
jgi:PAS domain S-box-containing protein